MVQLRFTPLDHRFSMRAVPIVGAKHLRAFPLRKLLTRVQMLRPYHDDSLAIDAVHRLNHALGMFQNRAFQLYSLGDRLSASKSRQPSIPYRPNCKVRLKHAFRHGSTVLYIDNALVAWTPS